MWKKLSQGNSILEQTGYYISYNDFLSNSPESELARSIDRAFLGYNTQEETALMIEDGDCLVLLGDWRKEYEAAIEKGGLEECKKLFNQLSLEWKSPASN